VTIETHIQVLIVCLSNGKHLTEVAILFLPTQNSAIFAI